MGTHVGTAIWPTFVFRFSVFGRQHGRQLPARFVSARSVKNDITAHVLVYQSTIVNGRRSRPGRTTRGRSARPERASSSVSPASRRTRPDCSDSPSLRPPRRSPRHGIPRGRRSCSGSGRRPAPSRRAGRTGRACSPRSASRKERGSVKPSRVELNPVEFGRFW